MDIWMVLLVVVALVLLYVVTQLVNTTATTRKHDLDTGHVDVDRQFKRPPSEGDLL